MNTFVTGGCGAIGSNLIDRLLADGHSVTCYDNLSEGKREFIAPHEGNPKFTFIQADILDFQKLKGSMRNHDIIFHLAANTETKNLEQDTDKDFQQNVIGTKNVLEAMICVFLSQSGVVVLCTATLS